MGPTHFLQRGGSTVSRNYSGFSSVGNYSTEIQDYINAHPIPEPTSFALLIGWVALLGGVVAGGRPCFSMSMRGTAHSYSLLKSCRVVAPIRIDPSRAGGRRMRRVRLSVPSGMVRR